MKATTYFIIYSFGNLIHTIICSFYHR